MEEEEEEERESDNEREGGWEAITGDVEVS